MPDIKVELVSFQPKCPHCKKELTTIGKIEHGFAERHIVYVCPHCHCVISVGYDNYVGF